MNSFLSKIYAFKFFDDFILIYPLYAVMFAEFGITPTEFGILLISWSVTAFLLEVPSGVLADKYSRKNILIVGQIIRAIGYAFWLFMPNFLGFLIGFILWAIKGALTSGTFEALLYDELKQHKKEKHYTKILGKTKTYYFTAIMLASILASPASFLGYPFVLSISIIAILIAGIAIAMLPPARQADSTHEKEYFQLLKKGLIYSFHHKPVWRIIIFLSLAIPLGAALDEFSPLIATEVGLPQYGLGIFVGIMSLIEGISSYFAYHLEKKSNIFFYALYILNGIILLLAGYFFKLPILILLIAYAAIFSLIYTVFEAKLQHHIPSSVRATVSSVQGFFLEVGALICFGGFSILAQYLGYQRSFIIFGIILISIGLGYIITSWWSSQKEMNAQHDT